MPETYQRLRVLIGCPGDLNDVAMEVINHLRAEPAQRTFRQQGYALEVSQWLDEHSFADAYSEQGGQQTINQTMLAEADVVLALFDKELGTAWVDELTGERFGSGTVAEVELARRARKT